MERSLGRVGRKSKAIPVDGRIPSGGPTVCTTRCINCVKWGLEKMCSFLIEI